MVDVVDEGVLDVSVNIVVDVDDGVVDVVDDGVLDVVVNVVVDVDVGVVDVVDVVVTLHIESSSSSHLSQSQ